MTSGAMLDAVSVGRQLREAREAAGVSQDAARTAIAVSQATYSRIEAGERPLKGDELIALADLFGVRAASIVGEARLRARVQYAAVTSDGSPSEVTLMPDRLYAYLELDSYLTSQGIV